jgi:hypothetical protein
MENNVTIPLPAYIYSSYKNTGRVLMLLADGAKCNEL